jgi:hypothetical protein
MFRQLTHLAVLVLVALLPVRAGGAGTKPASAAIQSFLALWKSSLVEDFGPAPIEVQVPASLVACPAFGVSPAGPFHGATVLVPADKQRVQAGECWDLEARFGPNSPSKFRRARAFVDPVTSNVLFVAGFPR